MCETNNFNDLSLIMNTIKELVILLALVSAAAGLGNSAPRNGSSVPSEAEVRKSQAKLNSRRRTAPVARVYRLTMDDMYAFLEEINQKIFQCPLDSYYSLNLKTCEPCRKLCNPGAESTKQCLLLCPDAYIEMKDSDQMAYFSLGIAILALLVSLLAIPGLVFFKTVLFSKIPSAEENTTLTDISCTQTPTKQKELVEEETPLSTPCSSRSSIDRQKEKGHLIPAQNEAHSQMVVDHKHPVPKNLM